MSNLLIANEERCDPSCDKDQIRGRDCFEDCARDEEELERVRSGLADCGPSCAKHVKVKCRVWDC